MVGPRQLLGPAQAVRYTVHRVGVIIIMFVLDYNELCNAVRAPVTIFRQTRKAVRAIK